MSILKQSNVHGVFTTIGLICGLIIAWFINRDARGFRDLDSQPDVCTVDSE